MIDLRVLGSLDIVAPDWLGASGLLEKPSPTALLVYLAVAPVSSFHRRDKLVALFWPESGQSQARANLRKLIHAIRGALGDAVIESRGDEEIRICESELRCDAAEFTRSVASGRLSRAMELYAGPLLPGFHLDGAGDFGPWLDQTRRCLMRDAAKAGIALAEEHVRNAERTEASDLARFIGRIGEELDDEYVFRKLLSLLEQIGDHATALKMYEGFHARLASSYGAIPAPETRALIERIKGQ